MTQATVLGPKARETLHQQLQARIDSLAGGEAPHRDRRRRGLAGAAGDVIQGDSRAVRLGPFLAEDVPPRWQ
jgi:hypothetical protein